jgi:hypothetical protein
MLTPDEAKEFNKSDCFTIKELEEFRMNYCFHCKEKFYSETTELLQSPFLHQEEKYFYYCGRCWFLK